MPSKFGHDDAMRFARRCSLKVTVRSGKGGEGVQKLKNKIILQQTKIP